MRDGTRSTTAERAALMRAVHHRWDRPRVLDDPIAARLIDASLAATVETDPPPYETVPLRRLRGSIALRSRFAEDRLADAVAGGLRQYVVLGAGLDSFAYRSPLVTRGVRVFEVDQPETQAWKRARLAAAGIDVPDAVAFVAVDLEREPLPAALARGGVDRSWPAFVSWLGTTVYLTRDAVRRTLAAVAALGPGSAVVFDYVVPPSSLPASARGARAAMAARAATAGEPWVTFFEPDELARELDALGFAVVDDLGPDDAIARYFRDRGDGLRPGSGARLVCAAVRG